MVCGSERDALDRKMGKQSRLPGMLARAAYTGTGGYGGFSAQILGADPDGVAGYRAVYSGQKTYNGVAILAREQATDIVTDIPGLDDPQRRILAATIGDLRVVDLYVVNGKAVGDEKYAYKLDWLARVREFLARELERYPKLVVLGDFNICPDDRDVYDPVAWGEDILCSPPERAALKAITDLGLHDSFRLFQPEAGH